MFRSGKQEHDETLDQFHIRLLHLSKYCEFVDLNRELKSQVIFGCVSLRVRRKALQEHGLTLNDILTYARTIETSEQQTVSMEENNKDRITVNKVNKQTTLKIHILGGSQNCVIDVEMNIPTKTRAQL